VMTRGMDKVGEQLNTDEAHLRAFWIQWNALMSVPHDDLGARAS
jgi:hypothetical protein